MTETATAWCFGPIGLSAGTVKSIRGARVEVESPGLGVISARLATAGAYRPCPHDSVLVASAPDGAYVIGVLRALRDTEERTIAAADGSSASLEHGEDGSVWRLRDPEGALIFEHRPGRSVVHLREDLEVRATGDLRFASGGRVHIESAEGATLASRGPIELATEGSSLKLDGDRASVACGIVEATSDRAALKTGEAQLVAGTLRSVIERVLEQAEVVERSAGRIVERAREVYREVDELSQTKAGRLRFVAKTALTLLGTQAVVKAREDVKIKGEKIYLG